MRHNIITTWQYPTIKDTAGSSSIEPRRKTKQQARNSTSQQYKLTTLGLVLGPAYMSTGWLYLSSLYFLSPYDFYLPRLAG